MKTLAAGAATPVSLSAAGAAELETRIVRLELRHTWTTTMSSSDWRDTLHVRYTRDGVTGRGEGAPISRYNENAEQAQDAVERLRDKILAADPREYRVLLAETDSLVSGQYAAKAAVDIAIMDWVGGHLGVPLYRLFGLDPSRAPATTFSIGIDTPEMTRQKVREAAQYPVLKIKVGLDSDEASIRAVRDVTDKPLRVDANEGWTDREEAIRKIEWLAGQGVELIEQPLPAIQTEDTLWLRERSPIPVIADEAVLHPSDIPALAEIYDGVNIKLDKAGGILPALRMIEMSTELGLETMLGCMISSSVSITAAAHLSPLVNYADLDGNLLIANDPYTGVRVEDGKLVLPEDPGLGLQEVPGATSPQV